MTAADAEPAQPPPDAGLVAVGTDLAVAAECVLQAPDGLIAVALPAVQDAEVFRCGGPGPRIGVPRSGRGEQARVAGGETPAVGRRGGQGREPRVGVGEILGGAGGAGGQVAVAGGQCGSGQPGRKSRVAEQEPWPVHQIVAELLEVAEGDGRPITRLGDLRLGQDGFGARVDVSELRAGGGAAGNLLGRGRDVTTAQLDHAQHAARGRGVPVRTKGLGHDHGRLGIGDGLGQAASGQVYAGPQDGQRRLGWDVMQRRVVRGAEDVLRLAGLAQVD